MVAAILPMALAVSASTAMACTPLPRSFSVSPDSAAARTTAEIAGEGVLPGTPVEILWNGLKGDVVARVEADNRGRFTLPITVPELAPGAYAIVFVAPSPHGSADVVGRVPFRLKSAGAASIRPLTSDRWEPRPAAPATSREGSAMLLGLALAGAGTLTIMGVSVVAVTRRRLASAGQ